MWCAMHPEQTEGVEIEVVQCEGAEDVRKKIMLTYQSGAYEDLPDPTDGRRQGAWGGEERMKAPPRRFELSKGKSRQTERS